MPYRINPHLDEQNDHRCHFTEREYLKQMAARDGVLQIDNVAVDVEQMILRTFQCDTDYCVRCVRKEGSTQFKGSCCTDLEVNVTPHEAEQIRVLGRMGHERLYLSAADPLRDVIRRITSDQFTELTEAHEPALRHLRTGRCSLSWMENGTLRCGLNTLCERLGEPLQSFKPDPCYLFPLHYVEYDRGQYLMTVMCTETYRWIGSDAYIGKLRCLRRPQRGARPVFAALRGEIILCLGESFYAELEAAARPILARAGLLPEEAQGESDLEETGS